MVQTTDLGEEGLMMVEEDLDLDTNMDMDIDIGMDNIGDEPDEEHCYTISMDSIWTQKFKQISKDHPIKAPDTLADRLALAASDPLAVSANEDEQNTLENLLRFGLVVEKAPISESSVPAAQFLATTLLNGGQQQDPNNLPSSSGSTDPKDNFSFLLRLGSNTHSPSIKLPSRCLLLLRHIAKLHNINIVIFSTRAKTVAFRQPEHAERVQRANQSPKGLSSKSLKGETDDPNFTEKRLEHVLQNAPTGLTLWKNVVKESFENGWSDGVLKVQRVIAAPKSAKGKEKAVESTEDPLDEESPTKAKERIRTATMTLRDALRPDLQQDGDPTYQTLVRLADDAQLAITNMIDEISCLTLKSTLIAAGGHLQDSPEAQDAATLDVMKLFPEGFKPRVAVASEIRVAPIPADLQNRLVTILKPEELKETVTTTKADEDIASLLTSVHLQRLHTRFMSPHQGESDEAISSSSASSGHPLWSKAEDIIAQQLGKDDAPPLSPSGISRTITEHIGGYSTSVGNLWQGSIYRKLLDYLSRIVLRLHLAPEREKTFKSRVEASVKAKQAKKEDPSQQSGRASRSLVNSKVMSLCNELSEVEAMPASPRRTKRVKAIIAQLQQLATPTKVPQAASCDSSGEIMDELSGELELDMDDFEDVEDPDDIEDQDDAGKFNHIDQKTDLEITDHECSVIARIANILRPYVPKRRELPDGTFVDHLPHVALRAPLALIANRALLIAGYNHFTRRITPLISADTVHGLALGAVGMYEVLCSSQPGRFDVRDAEGNSLTNVLNITRYPANKEAIFGAFFDMRRIKAVCKDHGLVFNNRITYVDPYTIRLTGKVLPSENRQPAMSPYEARRKINHGNPSGLKWSDEFMSSGLNIEQVEQNVDRAIASVKETEGKIKPMRKVVSTLQSRQTTLSHELRIKEKPKEPESEQIASSIATYGDLYKSRQELRTARSNLNPMENELATSRKEKYFWNNVLKAAKSPRRGTSGNKEVDMTTPNWSKHAVEDATEHLDLSTLLEGHGKAEEGTSKERRVGLAGTDYGICKMSVTVPQTLDQVKTHLNRYQVLANLQDSEDVHDDLQVEVPSSSAPAPAPPASASGLSKQQRDEMLEAIRLPEAVTITAPLINEASMTRRVASRRRRRLERPENKDVKQALEDIRSQSLTSAMTIKDVDTIRKARKDNRGILRVFENSDARRRDKQTQRLHTKKTMSKLTAAERRTVQDHTRPPPSPPIVSPSDGWCSECGRHHMPQSSGAKTFHHAKDCPWHQCDVVPVLMIGAAGTGVGSRIGGHARRGGGKMRKEHSQSCVVSMTNEYRTSQASPSTVHPHCTPKEPPPL
ncbi:MAG: hypothetical protein J3Q66DRAFT_431801 [Benniella sp.]|nr:MAG: hypothetical protein J3Q66DRAFT_431801 [Benniella sp.]